MHLFGFGKMCKSARKWWQTPVSQVTPLRISQVGRPSLSPVVNRAQRRGAWQILTPRTAAMFGRNLGDDFLWGEPSKNHLDCHGLSSVSQMKSAMTWGTPMSTPIFFRQKSNFPVRLSMHWSLKPPSEQSCGPYHQPPPRWAETSCSILAGDELKNPSGG